MFEEVIISAIAIISLIIATITDLKSREVPDYLSYFLIISGFTFRFFYSVLNNNWYYFLYGIIGFSICFCIGLLLYLTKQWGGGDSKLLMGLGIIFATKPFFVSDQNLFLLNLILNIFVAGALYGLFYAIYLAYKHKNNFIKEFKRLINEDKIRFARIFSFIISIILFGLILISNDIATKIILSGFIIFILFYVHLWIFVRSVENACMFKIVPVSKLIEGDWVADDIIVNKKIIYNKTKLFVEKKDILMFIKYNVKKVKIKEGIPFVPSFLIGTLFSLIFRIGLF